MYEVAQQYYLLFKEGKNAGHDAKEHLKHKLDELSALFSDNVAYHAFRSLQMAAVGMLNSSKYGARKCDLLKEVNAPLTKMARPLISGNIRTHEEL